MANDQTQYVIIFPSDDIFSKISEVLKKNGINETPIDTMFSEGPSYIRVIFKLAKNLAGQKISDSDFIREVQKQFKISDPISQNILKSLKTEILPLAEKIPLDVVPVDGEKKTAPEISEVKMVEKVSELPSEKPLPKRGRPPKNISVTPPSPIIPKIEKVDNIKKDDAYREPIG